MPYANTDTLTATDLNGCLRGLHRNNANSAVTGTTNETDMSSFTMTGGTMTATGRIVIEAAGTITGAAGTKRLRLYFGGTAIYDSTAQAGTADWFVRAIISNTAANAQRITIEASDHTSAVTLTAVDYTTAAIDTAANVIVKLTGTLSAGADTITQTKYEINVQQVA